MAIEFTVTLEDRIGALADLTETLAKGGVNIVAIHAAPCGTEGFIQLVTNNTDATVEALRVAGVDYVTREVLLLRLVDEPGTLARLARALTNAGININSVYITMSGQLVLDADNLSAAQKVALSLGAM